MAEQQRIKGLSQREKIRKNSQAEGSSACFPRATNVVPFPTQRTMNHSSFGLTMQVFRARGQGECLDSQAQPNRGKRTFSQRQEQVKTTEPRNWISLILRVHSHFGDGVYEASTLYMARF